MPKWFEGFGELGTPMSIPSWSKFQIVDEATNILLTGVPDEILRHCKHGIWIGDYKTARFTNNQDALAPMYKVQLNSYGLIATKIGLGTVYGLGLLYYEPLTDLKDPDGEALIKDDRFFLGFSPKLKPVSLEPNIITPLLRKVREICDLSESPPPRTDCHDCNLLASLILGNSGAPSSVKEDLIKSLDAQGHRKHRKSAKPEIKYAYDI